MGSRSFSSALKLIPFLAIPLLIASVGCESDSDGNWGGGGGGGGGGNGGGGGGAEDESIARVQEAMDLAEFQDEVRRDPDMSAVFDLAVAYTGVSDFQWAGRLEDDDGVRMIFAEMNDGTMDPAVLVRHCKGNDCVAALQFHTNDEDEIVWFDMSGEIPVRTARVPFQLRHIDESDPDGSARIAVENAGGSADSPGIIRTAQSAEGTPTDPNRRLHLASTFGKYLTLKGPNLDDLRDSMKSGGFPRASSVYRVDDDAIDTSLSTLGPDDAFVFLTHGDLSRSSGKVVGMSTARGYWGARHYPAARMTQQLARNPNGGPGIVILAGCKTEDLIPVFDNGSRIVLGFNGFVMPGAASYAVKTFFDTLSKGGTLQEALDAANAAIADPKLKMVVNPGADLSRRLVDVGTPSGSCSPDFAGSWQGQLIVTTGSDKLPAGRSADYNCGQFVMSMGESPYGACKGCWVSATFVSRLLDGCASDSRVYLSHQDTGAESTMDVAIVNKNTLNLTNRTKDSGGSDITRSGTFSRCN